MKLAVLIPAYNAEETIGDVVEGAIQIPQVDAVVVVDDGSVDASSAVAQHLGATVLRHLHNRGKGWALRTGFDFVLRAGFDAVLTLDADGQHAPGAIPAFLQKAGDGGGHIVLGSRMGKVRRMPFIRVMTNRLTSAVVSAMAGCRIEDSQTGYRFLRREVLERIRLTTGKYDMESELLIKAGRHGFKVDFVPIESIYADEMSFINPFVDTLRFICLVIRGLFWR